MKNIKLFKLRGILETLIYTLIAVMTLLIIGQVAIRIVSGITPAWIQEMAIFLMVWISFLSIALGFQDRSHIRIAVFVDWLPHAIQKWVHTINQSLVIIIGLVMLFVGIHFAWSLKDSTLSGLPFSTPLLYIPFALTGFLMSIYMALEIWHYNKEAS